MGSLPNLHELGKEEGASYKPGPALGHLCGGTNTTLTQEEKSKILHRYSGHAKVSKARSNGHEGKLCDDFTFEHHMATYSPISNRSARLHARRRDSLNSSIGATSVRRLIASVVRGTAQSRPRLPRRLLLTNLLSLCFSHLLLSAALLPFLALQSSVSVWSPAPLDRPFHLNVGSLLLSLTYLVAALTSLIGPSVVQKCGTSALLVATCLCFALFYAAFLYPSLWLWVPGAVVMGVVLAVMGAAQIAVLMMLAQKVEDEERRVCVTRRLARAFRASNDFGLIVGSLLSAVLISFTVGMSNREYEGGNGTRGWNVSAEVYWNSSLAPYDYAAFLDDIFDTAEGRRLCGAAACPPSFLLNVSAPLHVLPPTTSNVLAAVYAGMCVLGAAVSAAGLDRIRTFVYQDPLERSRGFTLLKGVLESFKDARLKMAAPLAVFIGVEQAFMYADFSKSYVICTLGIHRLNLVFLSMGLLQSIAACTLSMLLRTIRRYYVVAVGCTFHACLLMVLFLWKPTEDDPALFYVISASWGVCNAIWEMLSFTLLTGQFADNWESAFANTATFRFLGMATAFAFHGILCNFYKLYAVSLLLILAVVPFAWLEVRLENLRKVKNIIRL